MWVFCVQVFYFRSEKLYVFHIIINIFVGGAQNFHKGRQTIQLIDIWNSHRPLDSLDGSSDARGTTIFATASLKYG